MNLVFTEAMKAPVLLDEPLMDIKRTAKMLGIKEKTLRDWVWRGKIPYVKCGARVMFEPQVIRDFIKQRRVVSKYRVV